MLFAGTLALHLPFNSLVTILSQLIRTICGEDAIPLVAHTAPFIEKNSNGDDYHFPVSPTLQQFGQGTDPIALLYLLEITNTAPSTRPFHRRN